VGTGRLNRETKGKRKRKRERARSQIESNSPFVINGLDDESECRAYSIDILVHDLLDNRSLPRIIKAASEQILSVTIAYLHEKKQIRAK
jgi:hypothetical protein